MKKELVDKMTPAEAVIYSLEKSIEQGGRCLFSM